MKICVWSANNKVVIVVADTLGRAKDLAALEDIPRDQSMATWYNITDDCDDAIYTFPCEVPA